MEQKIYIYILAKLEVKNNFITSPAVDGAEELFHCMLQADCIIIINLKYLKHCISKLKTKVSPVWEINFKYPPPLLGCVQYKLSRLKQFGCNQISKSVLIRQRLNFQSGYQETLNEGRREWGMTFWEGFRSDQTVASLHRLLNQSK